MSGLLGPRGAPSRVPQPHCLRQRRVSWGFISAPQSVDFLNALKDPSLCQEHSGWRRMPGPEATSAVTTPRCRRPLLEATAPLGLSFLFSRAKILFPLYLFIFKFSIVEKLQIHQNRDTNATSPRVPATSPQQSLFFFPPYLCCPALSFCKVFWGRSQISYLAC